MSWRIHLDLLLRFGQAGYRLYLFKQNLDGSVQTHSKLTVHSYAPYALSDPDEYFLSDELPGVDVKAFLQAAADAAWEIGIKPQQLENNANELKATRFHLEDMRQLAGVKK